MFRKLWRKRGWRIATVLTGVVILLVVLILTRTLGILGIAASNALKDYGELVGAIVGFLGAALLSYMERKYSESVQRALARQQGATRKMHNIYRPLYNELCDTRNCLQEQPYPRGFRMGAGDMNVYNRPAVLVQWSAFKWDLKSRVTEDVRQAIKDLTSACESYNRTGAARRDLASNTALQALRRALTKYPALRDWSPPDIFSNGIGADIPVALAAGGDTLKECEGQLKELFSGLFSKPEAKLDPREIEELVTSIVGTVRNYQDGYLVKGLVESSQAVEEALSAAIDLLEKRLCLIRERYEQEPQDV